MQNESQRQTISFLAEDDDSGQLEVKHNKSNRRLGIPVYAVKTNLSTDEAVEGAVKYFWEGGLGLDLVDRDPCCARFEGSGVHVFVRVAKDGQTTINLETQEWDYDVKRFMQTVA